MAMINRFEDLEVWQLARLQAIDIWQLTQQTPFAKNYELKEQINRAAGSVMDNIAEGFERFSTKEFIQYLVISKGSNGEVRSQLVRAFDRGHISESLLNEKLKKSELIGKKLLAFITYLKSSAYKTKPQTSNVQPGL
jgi:four helix bundle protein